MAYSLPKLTDASPAIRLYQPQGQQADQEVGQPSECRSLEPLLLAMALKKMTTGGGQKTAAHRRAAFAKPALAIALAIVLGLLATFFGPQILRHRFSEAAAAGQGSGEASTTTDGQQLVAESARRLLAESSIKANVRFKVSAFEHEVVGVGSYLQLGDGPEKLLRLEMKSQVGDQTATMQEICSEDDYWVRRDVPQVGTSVGRASLRPIRQAIARMGKDPNIDPIQTWIVLGGMPRMMEELHRSFKFGPATASDVEFLAADNRTVERMPVWIVEGELKPEVLNFLTGNKTPEDLSKLPAQIPTRVELILGRADQVFPLFPYRITYFRPSGSQPAGAEQGGGAASKLNPLCTLEFYGVYHTSDIDPREFAYDPGDQEVADLTQQFMQRLGLVGK